MALTNEEVKSNQATKAAVKTPGTGKSKADSAVVQAKGREIVAAMSEEEKAALNSKSGSLHFVRLLGLGSKKSTRRVGKNENAPCSFPVGITLRSDEDIQIPVIDINKNKETGIDYATDVQWTGVKAGEEFDLNYYEFMYLILQPGYDGSCEAGGDPSGLYFSPKLPAYIKGDAKLPTPTINLKEGSIKAAIVDVDTKGTNGWEIKPEYAEKFGDLMKKTKPKRSGGGKSSTHTPPTLVAVALRDILGINK